MPLHTTTGRWRFGFVLSLLTALQWGLLPIALKGLLEGMDPFTVTWYRFFIAGLLLSLYVILKKDRPKISQIKGSIVWLLITAVLGLCGNYILYIVGLKYLSPSAITVVIQLAPIFLLLGGLLVFREHFNQWQWVGFAILIIGLVLFFNDRLDLLFRQATGYTTGVLLVFASAILWAIYALCQKQLLETFSSESILLIIYLSGSILFLPTAHPVRIMHLNHLELFLLGFCAVNTFLAYGCFAEALDHWEASRVSAVLALIPLITVACMKICALFFPDFIEPEHLNTLSIMGIFLVVGGSMLCSLSKSEMSK